MSGDLWEGDRSEREQPGKRAKSRASRFREYLPEAEEETLVEELCWRTKDTKAKEKKNEKTGNGLSMLWKAKVRRSIMRVGAEGVGVLL